MPHSPAVSGSTRRTRKGDRSRRSEADRQEGRREERDIQPQLFVLAPQPGEFLTLSRRKPVALLRRTRRWPWWYSVSGKAGAQPVSARFRPAKARERAPGSDRSVIPATGDRGLSGSVMARSYSETQRTTRTPRARRRSGNRAGDPSTTSTSSLRSSARRTRFSVRSPAIPTLTPILVPAAPA
jgi:hypothetical protein